MIIKLVTDGLTFKEKSLISFDSIGTDNVFFKVDI